MLTEAESPDYTVTIPATLTLAGYRMILSIRIRCGKIGGVARNFCVTGRADPIVSED